MKHIKVLAYLLSIAIFTGTCQPVQAKNQVLSESENIITESNIYQEELSETNSENEKILNDSEENFIESSKTEFSGISENSGYARSGMLKYDDQNSENFTVSDKKITMDLGEVRKIDYLRPSSRISWISSNPDSVQVDINGYLFAISSGKSVITGYYNGKKHKISVSVKRGKKKGR